MRGLGALPGRKRDFAEMLIRPHVFERGNSLLQRKAAVDRHAEPPRFESRPQIRLHAAVDLGDLGDAPRPKVTPI